MAGVVALELHCCTQDAAQDIHLFLFQSGALEQAAQGADLLLCDATYALPEQQEQAAQWGHSTFGQSAALAAKAGAKRLWLVHYSPMVTDPEQQLAQAQSIFPAAECGFDGKRITLHYEENEE
jgi:ribonuclease Z